MRWLALLVVVPACSAGVEGTPGTDKMDAAMPQTVGEYTRYRGTLAATQAMPFGGDPYCNYSVVLRDVEIDVVLKNKAQLVAMSVEDSMNESIVGTCPYTAEPLSRQLFGFDSSKAGPMLDGNGKVEPPLSGVAANRPMTAFSSLVSVRGDDAIQATGRWERTDQGPPLKWVITTAAVVLPPQTCTAGAPVCVGGSKGALFSCEDGMWMTVVRVCPTGCAPSKTACN